MLTANERKVLYKKCGISKALAPKSLPVLTFDQALNHREMLATFSGKEIELDLKNQNADFAVKVTGNDMSPRFGRGTLLIVTTKRAPQNGDFVLAYVHDQARVLFRKYVTDSGITELKTINEEGTCTTLFRKDRIIGVITETRLELA